MPSSSPKKALKKRVTNDSLEDVLKEALKQAYTPEDRTINRKSDGELQDRLGKLSLYLLKRYNEEREKLESRKDDINRQRIAELQNKYWGISSSPTAAERYLSNECIPALEKKRITLKEQLSIGKIEPAIYRKLVAKVEADLNSASTDVRQLRAVRELEGIAKKLELELGYRYLPNVLRCEKRRLMEELDLCMHRLAQQAHPKRRLEQERNNLVDKLEEIAMEFSKIASSPAEAEKYLLKNRGNSEGEKSVIDSDLKKTKENADEEVRLSEVYSKPAMYRFAFGDFEAISDSSGSHITRLIHRDGTQVAFINEKEIRVVSASGERAIYRDGEIVEVRDRNGNTVQFSGGKLIGVIDSEGYVLILDPNDSHRYAVIGKDGKIIFDPKRMNAFLNRFNHLVASFENAPILRGESTQFNFSIILERAMRVKGEAERRLKEISGETGKIITREVGIGESIKELATTLRNANVLLFNGDPTTNGFGAKLSLYGRSIKANIVSAETVKMLKDAATKNNLLGIFVDPENTMVIEVPEMIYKEEKKTEHPAQYSRVFTIKVGKEYLTILALHSKMLAAIRDNDFTHLGKHVYKDVYSELSNAGYNFVWLQLKLKHSKMYRNAAGRYGDEFMDAMSRKDYEMLGRYKVFDSLAHNIVHALTRRRTRAYLEDEISALNVTVEDRKLSKEFAPILIEETTGRNRYNKIKIQLEDAKRSLGDKLFFDSAWEVLCNIIGTDELQKISEAVLRAYLEAYGFDRDTSLRLGLWNSKVRALRESFFNNPTKEQYIEYQKADEFRDIVRKQKNVISRFILSLIDTDIDYYFSLDKKDAKAYREKCRLAFHKIVELARINDQCKATEEGLAIAMQRSRYRTRAVSTAFSMSIHLHNIAKQLGPEVLFREVCFEATPWDLVLRANQLRDISHNYNYSIITSRAQIASNEELMKRINNALDVFQRALDIAK